MGYHNHAEEIQELVDKAYADLCEYYTKMTQNEMMAISRDALDLAYEAKALAEATHPERNNDASS